MKLTSSLSRNAASLLTVLGLLAFSPVAHAGRLGDVNTDGKVTIHDAIRILLYLKGAPRPDRGGFALGDVHPWNPTGKGVVQNGDWSAGDGHLTVEDAVGILRIAVGLTPTRDIGSVVYTRAGHGPNRPQDIFYSADGFGLETFLYAPWDAAVTPKGDVYFSENDGHRIRMLNAWGSVSTIVGGPNPGFKDGPKNQARFNSPEGLALQANGDLIVADTFNHAIRKVTPKGDVTTLGGDGFLGHRDGPATISKFNQPNGVATDLAGNVYVADTLNNVLRKITPDGMTSTIAGDGDPGFTDGPALQARLYQPTGVEFDPRDGGLYIADMGNNLIRKLTAGGELITLAGGAGGKRSGHTDGYGRDALFHDPYGVDLDPQGRLWIADWTNELVRVMYPDGRVETVAGSDPPGYVDGPGFGAKFWGLMNVRVAPNGWLYLVDTDNQRIRVVVP